MTPVAQQPTYCTHCGGSIASKAAICVHCGVPVVQASPVTQNVVIFGYVLGFLMPILGLIIGIYCLFKGKHGHGIGIMATALLSFFFWVGFMEGLAQ